MKNEAQTKSFWSYLLHQGKISNDLGTADTEKPPSLDDSDDVWDKYYGFSNSRRRHIGE